MLHTITAMAIATRVSKLELETKNWHMKLAEKENIIHVLQECNEDPKSTSMKNACKIFYVSPK